MSSQGQIARRRVVVLVLDGLGLGVMPDADAEDAGANTLLHVDLAAGPLRLPTLESLGLGKLTTARGVAGVADPRAALGRCALVHPGADTFMGHQELMGGSLDGVQLTFLSEIRPAVEQALRDAGHSVESLVAGQSPLLVDGKAVVADNIEARPRLNINVTGSLDDITLEELTEVGEVVRKIVPVPRVIVVGGRGYDVNGIRAHIRERTPGQIGVDTPQLGVYDENYRVRHLGLDFATREQVPSRAHAAGHEVVLLGKAADVVHCEGARTDNAIPTAEVMSKTIAALERMEHGLIVSNVQETDLAGHEQDAKRYAQVLELVDGMLPELIATLKEDDVLLITGDHGNDPTIGHSQHTREFTPLLVTGARVRRVEIGLRESLADVGATAADLLGVAPVRSGASFADLVLACS
jgi:phosphopentomutase